MKKEERKARVLEAVVTLTERDGYPPSYRDLGEEIGLAHSAVFNLVEELRRDGLINDRKALHSRAITLTAAGQSALGGEHSTNGKVAGTVLSSDRAAG